MTHCEFEIGLACECFDATSRASDKPARMASYSTWLLEVLKAKWSDFSMRMSLGPSRTIPTPAPFVFEEPSIYSVH